MSCNDFHARTKFWARKSRRGAVARLANPERLAQYRAMRREVGAEIEVEITAATTLEFQIAVAPHPRAEVFESLRFVLNGRPIRPLEVSGVHGNERSRSFGL